MARRKAIPIYLYAINGRDQNAVIDYVSLFTAIASQDASQTVREVSRDLNYALALRQFEDSDGNPAAQRVFSGYVVAGLPDSVPLFFDYKTGVTEQGETPEGKWLAQQSRIVVSVSESYRYLALEGIRNGVTATRLGHYLGILAESILGMQNVEFDVIAVQSDSLREEIESFERIKQASAIITRPNTDWDDFRDKLTALADESAGHEVEATVKASKGGTLSKQNGIVATILSSLSSGAAVIKQFRVAGRKPNADRDTVVTSEKYQQKVFARPSPTASEYEVDESVVSTARSMIDDQLPGVVTSPGGQAPASAAGGAHLPVELNRDE